MDQSVEQLQCIVCARQMAACVHTINLFLNFLGNTSHSEVCCGSVLFQKVGVCCMW
jgi:hypothetical protein